MNYQVVSAGIGSMLKIKRTGQGPVPTPLRGVYTSQQSATQAIESYERSKENGKTRSRSTG